MQRNLATLKTMAKNTDINTDKSVIRRPIHLKGPLFEPFVPDGKTGLVPNQYFHQRPVAVHKNEYVARKRVLSKLVGHQSPQPVEPFAHIGRLAVKEQTCAAR